MLYGMQPILSINQPSLVILLMVAKAYRGTERSHMRGWRRQAINTDVCASECLHFPWSRLVTVLSLVPYSRITDTHFISQETSGDSDLWWP